mgnify:CR=1 FL=1
MKEEIVNERQCETEDEKIDIQQLLFKYIIHWPWFVGAVLSYWSLDIFAYGHSCL